MAIAMPVAAAVPVSILMLAMAFAMPAVVVLATMAPLVAAVMVLSLAFAVVAATVVTATMAMLGAVARRVIVQVPAVTHEVDAASAGVVRAAMLAPFFRVTRRDAQVKGLGDVAGRALHDDGLAIQHLRCRVADVDAAVEAGLADIDGNADVLCGAKGRQRQQGGGKNQVFHVLDVQDGEGGSRLYCTEPGRFVCMPAYIARPTRRPRCHRAGVFGIRPPGPAPPAAGRWQPGTGQ